MTEAADSTPRSEPSALAPLASATRPLSPAGASAAPGGPRRRRSRAVLWALLILLLAGAAGGAWYWKSRSAGADGAEGSASAPPGGAGAGGPGRRPGGNRTQPVSAQAARLQDVRVTVAAIGNVTALNTATVRSRVDGELRRILFREGQQVKAGDLLAEIDPRAYEVALAQVQGQLARDAALLRNAELDLARYKDLLAKDSIARQQVDTQEALVAQLRGTVQTDQAQVDNAKLQLSYTRITAPISGRLGLRLVDLGNTVRSSDATGLVSITQTQPVAVVFAVPEIHLPQINRQLKSGGLAVEAWDREQRNRLAQGRVTTTDNAIDATTGTIKLKAELANADGSLFPNQFVNIRLQLKTLSQALAVPNNAIQRGSMGTFVYLIKEDSTVSLRKVVVGAVDGDWVAIEGEVQPGDRLVTDGADRLREGAKVEVIAANRNRAGGGAGAAGKGGAASGTGQPAAGAASGASGAATAAPASTAASATAPGSPPAAAAAKDPAGARAAAPAAPAPGADSAAGGRPAWMDRLPPELVDKLMAMPPEERKAYLQKLRERRQQRESGG
ncbi:MdtA/MuxA family multidrug efflux RND transporter periplasmic adaptor subunit [Curvibacter sp. RS43]|uniref:MdtA/MuxA family multidrug efflux RND transporter periplasmic adaptor subunit n=1 Tax=Curvibacter microcysteis TaxID=3026419 RepID=UPI0023631405|nr:MdtA/MuxA family multidrug efflux RND transporter periplasmic adaptor subunit [Curvibacter sp. RS43]MDD0811390.1 MdtA/MuxA family multidrug efflux RND transporter periplasmic adaptor subunit [Curvibacter sp. RS43]